MVDPGRPSVRFLVLWHLLVAGLIAVVADLLVTGVGFWSDRRQELLVSSYALGAYAVIAVISIIASARGRPLRLATVIGTSLSLFALVFLALLLVAPDPPYSRALIVALVIIAVALAPGVTLRAPLRRWVPVLLAL